jgi:hypothetical protein
MSIQNFIMNLEIGPAWRYSNLEVHPLLGRDHVVASYRTLDEALQNGRFRVEEVSTVGCVPKLRVVNKLPEPVLLLDGEELIGAKQNRILNLTIMVPADSVVTIPVSCVEAGRWRHASAAFAAADRTQFARGRAKKLAQVTDSLKASGQRFSNQGDVWNEIELKMARMGGSSPTGAMAAIYESSRSRLDDFVGAMPRIEGQVGAVFLINGRIAGIDVFDVPETFIKAAAKLVRSYAVDALDTPPETAAEAPRSEVAQAPRAEAVRVFLKETAVASRTSFKAVGLGQDLRFDGDNVSGAALEVSERVVHLVAFPAVLFAGAEGEPGWRRTRPWRMRRFQ